MSVQQETDQGLNLKLYQIVNKMVGVEVAPDERLGLFPPIDVQEPTRKQVKGDQVHEIAKLDALMKHSHGIVSGLYTEAKVNEAYKDDLRELRVDLDQIARKAPILGESGEEIEAFARVSKVHSLTLISVLSAVQLYEATRFLRDELKEQLSLFGTGSGRPRNPYAYAIARRLAYAYARGTGEKPTYGTAAAGGHPSTRYAQALKEVFGLLGIKAGIRGPAEWAIKELNEDELSRIREESQRPMCRRSINKALAAGNQNAI